MYLCAYVYNTEAFEMYLISEEMRPQQFAADVVFVMDSSYDVDPHYYTRQKDFVKMMAQNLDVSRGNSRAAVITYGDRAPLITRFDDHEKFADFKSAVDSALYVGGMRRTDRALDSVIRVMNEARPTVPKVLVLLTAGGQAGDEGRESLEDASQPLRDLGVHVYVVAVGTKANNEELKPLVRHKEDIFAVESFKELPAQVEILSEKVEQSSGEKYIQFQRVWHSSDFDLKPSA